MSVSNTNSILSTSNDIKQKKSTYTESQKRANHNWRQTHQENMRKNGFPAYSSYIVSYIFCSK